MNIGAQGLDLTSPRWRVQNAISVTLGNVNLVAKYWRSPVHSFIINSLLVALQRSFARDFERLDRINQRHLAPLDSAQFVGTRVASFWPLLLTNEDSIMSISSINSASLDALQQAIQSQTTQSTSNTTPSADVLAQQNAFQAQLQQTLAQQSSGQVSSHHGHHHGHHHGQSQAVGSLGATSNSTPSTSSTSQTSVLSMLNAIPDNLTKSSG